MPGHRIWSGRRGSNPRPTAWKAVTLPLSYSRLATCAIIPVPIFRTLTEACSSTSRTWWTGEDSNPRSSQGAAGLQPAAIDRSATCPKFFLTTPELGAFLSAAGSCRIRNQTLPGNPLLMSLLLPPSGCNKNYKPLCPVLHSFHRSGPAPALPKKQSQLWSWRRDSNPRPSDYKSDALPAELRQRSQTSNYRYSVSELQEGKI